MPTPRAPFQRDNYTMLLYEQDGEPLGLIQFYVMDDDRYIQPDIFCIKKNYGRAVREFVEYLRGLYPGCELHFGVSHTNKEAVEALERLGFEREEVSLVGVMRFEEYSPLPETAETVRVTRENFSPFAALHAQWDDSMYWNSARLLEALDDWNIYMVQQDGAATAAVYFRYVDGSMEIFGVDFENDRFNAEDFRTLMVRALNQSKKDGMKDMTFLHEDETHPAAESVGIRIIDTYYGHKLAL